MKQILTVTAAAFILAASASQAQNLSSRANSGSTATSTVTASGAALAGSSSNNSLTFNTPSQSRTEISSSGTTTLKTAPDAIAPSLGSGHPCMINTSVGFSVIGGGASGGSGKVDVGCMMMRSNNGTDNMAGRYYYAAKDKTACQAWKRVGAIPSNYPCGEKEKRGQQVASTPTRTAAASGPPALKVNCTRQGGTIVPRVTAEVAAAYSSAQIKAACR